VELAAGHEHVRGAAMVFVGILVLGQIADGLTYTLARNGVELNPFMAALGGTAVALKLVVVAPFVGLLGWRLRRHPHLLLWLAAFGWLGALSNLGGYL
jgi:hypothetical protein